MRIKYFIEYNGKIFAYRATNKLAPLTKETYGKWHSLVEVTDETKDTIKQNYAEISYRQIDDDRIPKYLKNKIRHFNGPFNYTKTDADLLYDENTEVTLKVDIDNICKKLLAEKSQKMRNFIIVQITVSRLIIESWDDEMTPEFIAFHKGRIQVLKQLLETTD